MSECIGLCKVIGRQVVRSSVPIYTNGNMVCKACNHIFEARKRLDKQKIKQFIKANKSVLFDIVMDLTTGPTVNMLERTVTMIHEKFKHARCPCCNSSCSWRPSYRPRVFGLESLVRTQT